MLSLQDLNRMRLRSREQDAIGALLRRYPDWKPDGPRMNSLNMLRQMGASRRELEAADRFLEEFRTPSSRP
jgi:hypothetical protein